MAVEKFLCAKMFLKLLKREILNTIKFEFKRDLSIAFSNCEWIADDPNTQWKQFRDKFNEVVNCYMLQSDKEELYK